MKEQFIRDIKKQNPGTPAHLLGWIKNIRRHKNTVFIDAIDSTGTIQLVAEKEKLSEKAFELLQSVTTESAIECSGTLIQSSKQTEIHLSDIKIVARASGELSPRPRSAANLFSPEMIEQVTSNRHLYIRNEKFVAIHRFRSILMRILAEWFDEHQFIEVHTPILTLTPLYEDRSVIDFDFAGEHVCLSQCAGFYLESMVHGLERIYNIGPSFRGETSKSRRHLAEYWHVKAEIAWVERENLFDLVESMMYYVISQCSNKAQEEATILHATFPQSGLKVPYPRISYREAIKRLQVYSIDCEFGKSLPTDGEDWLANEFKSPFWLVGIPRSIEPFPYVIDPNDRECTMTADLILPDAYGELLGIAEKIHDPKELEERMKEKDKFNDPRYEWCRELREFGCVPHGGFGMGFERLIRWLLQLTHVREAIAFPRVFYRNIYP